MSPVGERPGSYREVVCPDCQTPSPVGTEHCPKCGFPLALHAPDHEQAAVDPELYAKPGDAPAGDATFILPGVLGPNPGPAALPRPPASAGSTICPSCGRPNEAGQERWCEWCGADMRPPVRAPMPEPDFTPPPRRSNRAAWLAAALIAVLVLGAGWVFLNRDDEQATPSDARPAPGAPAPIDAARISARASSTLKQSADKYVIQKTLDGREDTAWQSAGKQAGVTLTYTFDTAVDLRSITVRNGAVRSPERGRKSYPINARLRQVTVRTESGQRTWQLQDTPKAQTFEQPFGRTRTVRLLVEKVYPGTEFDDLALTEITFGGIG